jgi:hypothetical protein
MHVCSRRRILTTTRATTCLRNLRSLCQGCIPDKQTLIEEVAASESRNNAHAKLDWGFTTADARVNLKRLFPAE